MRRGDHPATHQATLHRPLGDAPALIPGKTQDPTRSHHVALLEHVDGQALEQRREPGHRLRPRKACLAHPVVGALDTRWPGVQIGQEPATVEVAPGPLLAVVVHRQRRIALRTGEANAFGVADPHVNSHLSHRQLDPIHLPRLNDTQQMAVELCVTHSAIVAALTAPSNRHLFDAFTHGKPGSAQFFFPSRCCAGAQVGEIHGSGADLARWAGRALRHWRATAVFASKGDSHPGGKPRATP